MARQGKFHVRTVKKQNHLLFGVFGILYLCILSTIVVMVDTECEYFTNKHLMSTFIKIQQLQLRNQLEMGSNGSNSGPTSYANNRSRNNDALKVAIHTVTRSNVEKKKKRTESNFKLMKRRMIEEILSKHIDHLQVNLLRDRLQLRGLSVKETFSIHPKLRYRQVDLVPDLDPKLGPDLGLHKAPPKRETRAAKKFSVWKQFDTCAVVGNSDIILQSKCGAEIDAHDFVMRSNMAPTRGFDEDVGNRTDIMAVHQIRFLDIVRCTQNQNSVCYERVKRELSDLGKANMWIVKHGGINPRSFAQIEKFGRYNVKDLLFSHSNLKYLKTTISSFWGFNVDISSNGIFLFTVAVPLCKKISLYGFRVPSKTDKVSDTPYFMESPLKEFNPSYGRKQELRQLEMLNATQTMRLVSLPCSLYS